MANNQLRRATDSDNRIVAISCGGLRHAHYVFCTLLEREKEAERKNKEHNPSTSDGPEIRERNSTNVEPETKESAATATLEIFNELAKLGQNNWECVSNGELLEGLFNNHHHHHHHHPRPTLGGFTTKVCVCSTHG
eukprot:SAG31_NODE_10721_length_1105_cov_6.176938_1_plen_136_part_00